MYIHIFIFINRKVNGILECYYSLPCAPLNHYA